jgi:hypothetical protein
MSTRLTDDELRKVRVVDFTTVTGHKGTVTGLYVDTTPDCRTVRLVSANRAWESYSIPADATITRIARRAATISEGFQ